MSLVTRCPVCFTQFKVVPDQIRIAAGWVRCGQCDEVFDASVHMLPHAPGTGASEPVAPAPVLVPGTRAGDAAQEPDPGAPDGERRDPDFNSELLQRVKRHAAPTELARDAAPMQPPSETEAATEAETETEAEIEVETEIESGMEAEVWPAPESLAPSFVADAQRLVFWRLRPVRVGLRLALLLL
ncbi:MAG: hypothetical protein LBQ32_11285, partial [Burkholderiaceae bacterium]|nr:hypothetical protein [Burkholderiaceae bacterium]